MITCCSEETRARAAKSALGWTRRPASSSVGSGSPSTAAHGLRPLRGLAADSARWPVAPMGLVRRRGNREGRRGWRRAGAGESSGVAHPLLVVAYICWAMTPRGPP